MTTTVVEWFSPARAELEWFGQTTGTIATIARQGVSAVASVIGPPGPSGSAGNISDDSGNILTTGTDGGLFVNGAFDLGTFN
jgi:hypothetical protein